MLKGFGKGFKGSSKIQLILILLLAFLFLNIFVVCAAAEDLPDLPDQFLMFISEPEWEEEASWSSSQRPLISSYDSSSCCAYCADFVKYCYDIDGPTWGNEFDDIDDIQAGDVIKISNGVNTHWFAVLKRAGNKLYTAEGNSDPGTGGIVRIGWKYTIRDDSGFWEDDRPFSVGYHFGEPEPMWTGVVMVDRGQDGIYYTNENVKMSITESKYDYHILSIHYTPTGGETRLYWEGQVGSEKTMSFPDPGYYSCTFDGVGVVPTAWVGWVVQDYTHVQNVTLNKTSLMLNKGNSETLTATISPSDATNKSVTWTSSNTSVATVSSSGSVTGVGTGNATITVKTADGSKTATCSVIVKIPVIDVTLNKTSLSLIEGNSETLTATVAPSDATNKSVTWISSNTSVATVSSSGVVQGIAAGTAIITVKTADGNKNATCTVTVTPADTVCPVVAEAKIKSYISEGRDGYKVYCKVTDNEALSKIYVGTWNDVTGRSGIVWNTKSVSGTSVEWSLDIKVSDFNNARNTTYHTEIYVVDAKGNTSETVQAAEYYIAEWYPLTLANSVNDETETTTPGYPAGKEIIITAQTIDGYVFDHWTCDYGEFKNATSASTVFTMPESEATVTAIYTKIECTITINGKTEPTAKCLIYDMVNDGVSIPFNISYNVDVSGLVKNLTVTIEPWDFNTTVTLNQNAKTLTFHGSGIMSLSAVAGDYGTYNWMFLVMGNDTFQIPQGTMIIEEEAFANTKASIVVIPDSVISIGSQAFPNAKIVLMNTMISRDIASDAFPNVFAYVETGTQFNTDIYGALSPNLYVVSRNVGIPDIPTATGKLDVNGYLDGTDTGSVQGYGTFDVYINGSLDADDVYDYNVSHPIGTRYEIKDIKASSGKQFDGERYNSSLSGTIISTDPKNIQLAFSTIPTGRLDINGYLDGQNVGNIKDYGTFDIYINGKRVKDDVYDFDENYPIGTTYSITDIKTKSGKQYEGVYNNLSLKGTISTTDYKVIRLIFSTITWSEWSSWSDTEVTATSTKQVETRTVYRYRDTTYSTVYSNWSDWGEYTRTRQSIPDANLKQEQSAQIYVWYWYSCSSCGAHSPRYGNSCPNGCGGTVSSDYYVAWLDLPQTTSGTYSKTVGGVTRTAYNAPGYGEVFYNPGDNANQTYTGYRYRTRTSSQQANVGNWSSYSVNKPTEKDNREIQSKKQYRYRTKTN